MALPEQSLAARQDPAINAEIVIVHPKGVWPGNEEVRKMTILSSRNETTKMSISMRLYPHDAPNLRRGDALDVPEELDTYDQRMWRGRRAAQTRP